MTLLRAYHVALSDFQSQTGVYHHVTGTDASSSASIAAYVNTIIYSPNDKSSKVIQGLYWYASMVIVGSCNNQDQLLQCLLTIGHASRSQNTGRSRELLHR